jgi:hypothetical protein
MSHVCKQCGTKPDDWSQDRFAFVANPTRCLGCETIELEREQIPEKEKGIYIGLLPRELAEAQELVRGDSLMGADTDAEPDQEGGLL